MRPNRLLSFLLAALVPSTSLAQVVTVHPPVVPVAPLAAAGAAARPQPALSSLALQPSQLLRPVLNRPHPSPLPLRGRGNTALQQLVAAAAPAAEPSTEVPLLNKADDLGVPRQAIAEAIRGSDSYLDAAKRLSGLGLMSEAAAEAAASKGRELQLRFSLHRLWYEVAPTLPPQFESDENWPVPALVVKKNGTTYYVHGLLHGGKGHPTGWRQTRALARELERRGLPLYWEQGLPAHYGSSYGREALDHTAEPGKPAALRDAPKSAVLEAASMILRRLTWTGVLAAAPLAALAHDPSSVLGWAGLALAAVPISELWTGLRRLQGLHMWAESKNTPLADEAHNALTRVKAAFGKRVKFEDLWRVDLPAPLKLVELPRVAERS
ncbi:MAG: hypothetical protein HY925_14655, partial [Elusimicrobia bacterium]|nr:hypothetical protein [Elusimicrobiota bacterium]